MTMIVNEGDYLKEIKDYIKRVNQLNDRHLEWAWANTDIKVYEGERVFVVSQPSLVIWQMQRKLSDWFMVDPDA